MAGYGPQGGDRMLTPNLIAPNARRAVVPGLKALLAGVRNRAHPYTVAHPGNGSATLWTNPPQTAYDPLPCERCG